MREKLLDRLALATVRKPWLVAVTILLFTILTGFLAERLELKMSYTNLMPKDHPKVLELNRIIKEYDGASTMIVVAQGSEENLKAFAEALVPALNTPTLKPLIKAVDYRLPTDFIQRHGLMLMKTEDLEKLKPIFTPTSLVELTRGINDALEQEYTQSETRISTREKEMGALRFLDQLDRWVNANLRGLQNPSDSLAVQSAVDALTIGDPYYLSWDRRTMVIQIHPTFTMLDVEKSLLASDSLDAVLARLAPKYHVETGATGSIVLTRDEYQAVMNDSMIITILALVAIVVLFMISFRMLGSPLLALITLVIGIIWAMGLAWVLVGSLNIMTSMMAVLLAGLGIDFSIHVIALFTERRQAGDDLETALRYTLKRSGGGIITGALTSAAAFLTMVISTTQGMRELGLVLGVGIIMTMAASLTVLPLLLVWYDRLTGKKYTQSRSPRDLRFHRLGKMAEVMDRNRKPAAVFLVLLTLWLGWEGSHITMDYNYLNMEPEGLTSIKMQDVLIDRFDISSDFALVTASSLAEADSLTRIAKNMSTVGMVQSITEFLPPPREQMRRAQLVFSIRRAAQQPIPPLRFTATEREAWLQELYRLEDNIMELQDLAFSGGQDKVFLKSAFLTGVAQVPEEEMSVEEKELISELKEVLGTDIYHGSLSRLIALVENNTDPAGLAVWQASLMPRYRARVVAMADPTPIRLRDLPLNLRLQMVGKSGDSFLISIFPRANVWDLQFLKRFCQHADHISPRSTGMPPIFNLLVPLVAQDGKRATLIAVGLIFLLLLADFKKLKLAFLGMIPLAAALVWTVGIMHLTGMQFNIVNVMIIPMIVGIGIDDGVHIIHRMLVDPSHSVRAVFSSTGRAIMLTTLTTMLAFGSLKFATYRGLGSAGMAAFIGVGACFVATVVILGTLLRVALEGKAER